MRWQSTEPARLRWTVGAFWQLAKEGSIEELKDPDQSVLQFISTGNYLFGETATAFFGLYFSCPTTPAYRHIPACYIYYNNNTTYDRQIAGYGEMNYALTDQLAPDARRACRPHHLRARALRGRPGELRARGAPRAA